MATLRFGYGLYLGLSFRRCYLNIYIFLHHIHQIIHLVQLVHLITLAHICFKVVSFLRYFNSIHLSVSIVDHPYLRRALQRISSTYPLGVLTQWRA